MTYTLMAIDLLKLYAQYKESDWINELKIIHSNKDLNKLTELRRGIQIGMHDLEKAKMNTPKINEWFCWLTRTVDVTARKIFRDLHPNVLDDPVKSQALKKDPYLRQFYLEQKAKKQDREILINDFTRKVSY